MRWVMLIFIVSSNNKLFLTASSHQALNIEKHSHNSEDTFHNNTMDCPKGQHCNQPLWTLHIFYNLYNVSLKHDYVVPPHKEHFAMYICMYVCMYVCIICVYRVREKIHTHTSWRDRGDQNKDLLSRKYTSEMHPCHATDHQITSY